VISYIRRNLVAFAALFIAIILSSGSVAYAANTIYSSDIVDGQVKNQDLADNAVGTKKIQDHSILGRDIKDNSLGRAQIKESTLGQVPNAKTIDGQPLETLKQRDVTQLAQTDECAVPNVWSQCDLDSVTVPAGHAYVLTVTSEITADPGANIQTIEYCPAYTGPTCINDTGPEAVTLPANQYTNASTSASRVLQAGTYTLSTAIKVAAPLVATTFANTATNYVWYDLALLKG
jgi:hypothetical protein